MPLPGRKMQGKKKGKQQRGKRVHVNKYAGCAIHKEKTGSKYKAKQRIPLDIRLREGQVQKIMQQKGISRAEALEIVERKASGAEAKRKAREMQFKGVKHWWERG